MARLLTIVLMLLAPAATSFAQAAGDATDKKPTHPTLVLGAVTLEFTARLENDLRVATPAIGLDRGRSDWQDRRIGVEGTAFRRIKFEVSRELAEDFESSVGLSDKTAWRDAYADVRLAKALSVEGGRFKVPFGREELLGEPHLDFVRRSLVARVLSPGRDTGVMAHGRLFDRVVEYHIGVFSRDGDNSRTAQTQGGRDALAARLVLMPFRSSKSSQRLAPFEIGLAAMKSHLDERLGLRGRTVLGDGVFFDRVYVNGRRTRMGLDAAWANGPVGLSAEYVSVSDERTGMGFGGGDLPPVSTNGWYLAATWALTGERKEGRLEPRRDVLRGGFGAVELAARVETLRFEPAVAALTSSGSSAAGAVGNADRVTTLGVNWYLNHYIKVQGNIVMEAIEDPQRSPAPSNDGRFTTVVVRLQVRL